MGTRALPVERLRQYLRELPSGARAHLIAELERALLRGEEIPGGDMLLQEVRTAVRDAGARIDRIGDPARLFFRPVEPFLVNNPGNRKHRGRVARGALGAIWTWISRDLMPAEAAAYDAALSRAAGEGAAPEQSALVHAFQGQAVQRMSAALEAARSDEKSSRRLVALIGSQSALDEVRDVCTILGGRDALMSIGNRLPGHVRNFVNGQIDTVKALIDSTLLGQPGLLPYALILVMGRLATPWQLIRLAVRAAESDEAGRIANTPYAAAVTITLAEVERMVDELRADLERGAAVAVTAQLKCIHDTARALHTELDLSADSPWARQLSGIRAEVSRLLSRELEAIPGLLRRLLRPRPAGEIAHDSVLDPIEVADAEGMIELIGACRNYASELAINEITLRIYSEIQKYLDTATQALLDALRWAGEADRDFRKSQVDAAVRFCAKVFGKDYASLLTKAAEIAAGADHRVPAKA